MKTKTGLTDKIILDHIATRKAMEDAARRVVESVLQQDKEGVIFQELSSFDDVQEVELADLRVERNYVHRKGKLPKLMDVLRFLARVRADSGRESVWIDAYLLSFHGDELNEEVKKYLARITEPIMARRRENELRRMKALMSQFPDEAQHILKAPPGCNCTICRW